MFLPLYGVWGQLGYEPRTFSCTIVDTDEGGDTFFPSLAAIGVGLPCLIILASYGAIYYRVKRIGKFIIIA